MSTNSGHLTLGGLSEQEIRSIIRRRIIFEELRHSTAQKMILSEVSSGLNISSFGPLTTALSSIPFIDDASMAAVLPWLLTSAEALLFGSSASCVNDAWRFSCKNLCICQGLCLRIYVSQAGRTIFYFCHTARY